MRILKRTKKRMLDIDSIIANSKAIIQESEEMIEKSKKNVLKAQMLSKR